MRFAVSWVLTRKRFARRVEHAKLPLGFPNMFTQKLSLLNSPSKAFSFLARLGNLDLYSEEISHEIEKFILTNNPNFLSSDPSYLEVNIVPLSTYEPNQFKITYLCKTKTIFYTFLLIQSIYQIVQYTGMFFCCLLLPLF